MTDPWDEDLETYVAPWDEDLAAEQKESSVEKTAKKLKNINLYQPSTFGDAAIGVVEALLSMGSGIAGQLASGYTGIAGGIAGMVPGGEAPWEKAGRWQAGTQEAMTYQPRSEAGEQATEAFGEMLGMAEKPVRFAGSGYAALGALPGGVEEASLAQEDFMAEESPLREGVYQVTQSPGATAIAAILPELAALGFVRRPGTGITGRDKFSKQAPRYPQQVDIPEGYGNVTETPGARTPWSRLQQQAAPAREFEQLKRAVKAKDAEQVAKIVNANPAIVAAFEELGIEYAPQMVSESAAVRTTASGLKTAPGSDLPRIDETVKANLDQRVDEFINRYGTTDRNYVDESLRDRFDQDIARLEREAEAAFEDMKQWVEPGAEINMTSAVEFIDKRISDLGAGDITEGLKQASKHERALWNLTHKWNAEEKIWEYKRPSYAAVDAYRKEVGRGISRHAGSRMGRFKDGDQGELKNTYRMLAEAQQEAADYFGFGEEYIAANDIIKKRKGIEEAAVQVFGRNMERGMIQAIDAAAVGLTKGDINKFRNLMENVPKEQQQMVAVAVLNNLFKPGAQKSVGVGRGFLQSAEALKRYPGIKDELFSYLPPQARRQFDTLYEASRGFFRSLEKDNTSNTALGRNVVESLENGSLFTKLMSGLSKKAPIGRDWLEKMLSEGPSKRRNAAENFLKSEDLNRAVREYAAGRDRMAREILNRSTPAQVWLRTLDEASRAEVERLGITAFLFTSQVEEQ